MKEIGYVIFLSLLIGYGLFFFMHGGLPAVRTVGSVQEAHVGSVSR
jgi:hypothetical protein